MSKPIFVSKGVQAVYATDVVDRIVGQADLLMQRKRSADLPWFKERYFHWLGSDEYTGAISTITYALMSLPLVNCK